MFDTQTPPKRADRLVELAQADLANAQDNLYRARSAAKGCDINAEWGKSGTTLGEIIKGYEDWVTEARATLERARTFEAR